MYFLDKSFFVNNIYFKMFKKTLRFKQGVVFYYKHFIKAFYTFGKSFYENRIDFKVTLCFNL